MKYNFLTRIPFSCIFNVRRVDITVIEDSLFYYRDLEAETEAPSIHLADLLSNSLIIGQVIMLRRMLEIPLVFEQCISSETAEINGLIRKLMIKMNEYLLQEKISFSISRSK